MNNYDESWKSVRQLAIRTAVDIAWQQWAAVGSLARPATDRIVRRVVDPEALVLVSLAFREHERRLEDMVRWWAHAGAPLTNVQRMRSLVSQLGGQSSEDFTLFSGWATDAGHRSWKRYAATEEASDSGPDLGGSKGPEELRLVEPSTLMLRMRAAFGVSAKPDVLTFLVGLRGTMASVSAISRAVGYTETAVRGALKTMAMARLVHETTDRPVQYMARHRRWVDLLELEAPGERENDRGPQWGMWAPLFGFLITAHELGTTAGERRESDYITSSEARDAVERYSYAFSFHDIPLPHLDRYQGHSFVHAFLEITESVEKWIHED